jgi:pimeloyl-ACP methyl ester carboxylesterase
VIGSQRQQDETAAHTARLIDVAVPEDPAGVVVVLHGGGSRPRDTRVSPAQLSVLRMIPVASRIVHASGERLAVLRLLNSRRGWDTEHTPVVDVRWALGEVAQRFGPDLAVCLVGHSLGGRAALLCAREPQVHGVVALAPWVLPTDPIEAAQGTPIVIIHGDSDRVALPARSRQIAEKLQRGAQVSYVTVRRGTHAMLRRNDAFDGLAARCVVWMLLGRTEGETVRRIAAGETWLEV